MNAANSFSCPKCRGEIVLPEGNPPASIDCPHCKTTLFAKGDVISGRDVYNIVSDLGTGVNLRMKDNLYQLAAIGIGLVLGIAIGFFSMNDHATGAVLGGFIGLLAGLFGSGIFLMVYRFIRHTRGHHQ